MKEFWLPSEPSGRLLRVGGAHRTKDLFLLSVDEQETIAASNFRCFSSKQRLRTDRCLQPTAQSVPLHPPGLPIVTIFTTYRRLMLIVPSPAARARKRRDDRCVQGGGQGEEIQLAREPQIRERLRRQGCQTHPNEDCCQTGDRCLQGGGEGQKDKVASQPEVRQKLHHNGSQRASHHERQRIAQRGECKDFAGATTSGMGMCGDDNWQGHRLLSSAPVPR